MFSYAPHDVVPRICYLRETQIKKQKRNFLCQSTLAMPPPRVTITKSIILFLLPRRDGSCAHGGSVPGGREGKGRTCTESIWGLGAAGPTSPGKSRGGEASSRTAWLRTSTLSRWRNRGGREKEREGYPEAPPQAQRDSPALGGKVSQQRAPVQTDRSACVAVVQTPKMMRHWQVSSSSAASTDPIIDTHECPSLILA